VSFGNLSVGVVSVAASSSLVGLIAASVLVLTTGFGSVVGKGVVVALSSSRGIVGVGVVVGGLGPSSVLIIVGSSKGLHLSGASSLFVVGFVVVVKIIGAASLSLLLASGCVVVVFVGGVCAASGLGVVSLIVVQRAGESLRERPIAREAAIVVVIVVVVFVAMVAASSLLRGGRGASMGAYFSHILRMSAIICFRSCRGGGKT